MKLRTWLKGLVFALAACATLIALIVAVENYRGKRVWEACQRELQAKGEVLDWRALTLPPVPDDQNFYKTPLLAPLTDWVVDPATGHARLRDTNAAERSSALYSGLRPALDVAQPSWRVARCVDFAAWQAALREQTNSADPSLRALLATPVGKPAADVLFVLNRQAAGLEEIRAASRRPHARVGLRLQEGVEVFMPQLARMKGLAQAFQVKALAELAENHTDAACEDVLTCLRLARALREEPLLITTLVEYATFQIGIQPLWEGLARHQWNERHLAAFEEALGSFNCVADLASSLRYERVCTLATLDNWQRRPEIIQDALASSGQTGTAALPRLPGGWIAQNKACIARMLQDFLLPVLDPTNALVDVRLSERLNAEAQAHLAGMSPYKVLARMLLPALSGAANSGASVQATLNLARIAVALERCRLADGAFPEKLDALAPRFLPTVPRDVVNGQPHVYRREANDRFVLYSVGLNLKDDGGQTAVDKKGRPQPKAATGDWVWHSGPEKM